MPEEYGGQGGTLMDALIVIEELAKECRPAAWQVFEANTGPIRVLEFFGTEDHKHSYLARSASGEISMAIGISEPDAGSAATDMRTAARLDGDEWVINGSKRWISNGGHADHYLRLLPAQRRARAPRASARSSSRGTLPASPRARRRS